MAIGSLVPPAPVTGETQAGCYMAGSRDCGGGISREHYITRSLIDGPEVTVRGFPWQREEVARYSPDNLVARILCRRHNSALSPLDAHAKRFFLALEAALQHAQRRSLSKRSRHFMASGDGLELWAMKTLAGLYATGIKFTSEVHRFRDYTPPMDRIVAQLSSRRPVSLMTLGFPMQQDAHEERLGRRAVTWGPILEEGATELSGLLVRLQGVALDFHIDADVGRVEAAGEIVRPDMIDIIGPERTSRIYLSWTGGRSAGKIVEIRIGRRLEAR